MKYTETLQADYRQLIKQKDKMMKHNRIKLFYIFLFILVPAFSVQVVKAQRPALMIAVENNNIKEVRSLLDKGADPNLYDDDSNNVLIHAAVYGSADCMKLLLLKKANPNLKNKYGQTPLMLCTDDMDKMKLLLQYGADINEMSKSGNTALLMVCGEYGQYKTLEWLIKIGADPHVKRGGAEAALMRAAQFGDTMTIRLLLSNGLGINEHGWGSTPLMYAIRRSNWPVVFTLLDNGADPNIPDDMGMSPILWAAELNNADAVNAMLKKVENINTIDSLSGMTPLMWATYNEHDNPQIIQAFLEKGAQVNAKDKNGLTALSWAIKKGNTATVKLLKKYGAK